MPSTATRSRRERRGRRTSPKPPGEAAKSALLAECGPATPRARNALLVVLAVAFLLRATRLGSMFPILVDESIYLRWAEIIDHQGQWFISLLDGKPPLSYWVLALARFVWDGDPLLAARFVSVLVGTLSTAGVFALARRLAPADSRDRVGLIAAGLYAVFPWALLYDRLAYSEAFVNLFGVGVALTAVLAFERDDAPAGRAVGAGIVFGLGLFTKQTVILFGLVPLAAAFAFGRLSRAAVPRLAAIYAVAALFLLANRALTPAAPMLETHDAVLHHTGFFASPAELLEDPFTAARTNAGLIVGYVGAYVTWPLALVAVGSAAWLLRTGAPAGRLWLAGSLIPITVEVFLLQLMFPTRYPFAHFALWLVAAALGIDAARRRLRVRRAWLVAAAAVISAPPLYRAASMIARPAEGLHPADVEGFLGDHAHVGYGIAEAISFLENEARTGGGFILLTDPIWGPPADALFPYLNHRLGIRVFEAWWTQLSGTHPILPAADRADVLRSHYERVKMGQIDFSRERRIFYVTDTHYYSREAVKIRQPDARLAAAFPKRNGHSIDVYRLK